MKVYADNDNINILQSIASASTLIGSLANVVREYIVSKFTPGYFKHIYIDTSETVVQQNRNAAHNSFANKIPYPSMGISPEISLDDPIGGMEKSMHLSSPNLYMRKDAIREYRKLVVDPDEKFSLMYTGDYITTNFNFKIITNTFMQNADVAFWLKSKFQSNFFQYLNEQHLQTEIPKSFIKFIANIKGWNLDNPDDMDSMRLFLIGTGKRPTSIQKRRSLSTGKECFFIDDEVNLLTLFTDLDCPSSVNRDSQVEGEYIINFRFQVSTYLTNAFILSLNKSTLRKCSKETIEDLDSDKHQFEEGTTSSISLSLGNILGKKDVIYFTDSAGSEQIGHLVYENKYLFDTSRKVPKLFLLEELPEEYQRIHSYAVNKLNLDTTSLSTARIYSRGGRMSASQYTFDNDSMTLELQDNLMDDFAVSVYVNRLLYESIRKSILTNKDFFNNGYMTNMMVNIAGETVNAVVKKFEDKRVLNSSDIDKSLRIKTPYGVGYISLLEDTDSDGYKICVGHSEDGTPIIRKFEIEA